MAPTLLYYEVNNALHQYVVQGLASPSEAEALLDVALRLDLVLHDDPELHKHALKLAQHFPCSPPTTPTTWPWPTGWGRSCGPPTAGWRPR